MITTALAERARRLQSERHAFVTATVVRAQSPTSANPGDVALVLADGTIEGFVGGVCAEESVRLHSARVMETGEPIDRPDLLAGIEDIMQLMDYDDMRALEARLLGHDTIERKYGGTP